MPTQFDLLFCGPQVLTSVGLRPAQVGIRHGRIAAIEPLHYEYADFSPVSERVFSLGKHEVLIPGVVNLRGDVVNAAGPAELNPEYLTTEHPTPEAATQAAVRGGATTVVDSPDGDHAPTETASQLQHKQQAVRNRLHCDVGFWAGPSVVEGQLAALAEAGCCGLEVRDEDGLEELLSAWAGLGIRQPVLLTPAPEHQLNLVRVLEAVQEYQSPVHLCGIHRVEDLAILRQARADGLPLTGSVDASTLVADHPMDAPRSGATAAARTPFWEALGRGVLSSITVGPGQQGWSKGWLPLVWTEAWLRGVALTDLMRWLAGNPAHIAGLDHKGRIEVGWDADLLVFSPQAEHRDSSGTRLLGQVTASFLRGEPIDLDHPRGQVVKPNRD